MPAEPDSLSRAGELIALFAILLGIGLMLGCARPAIVKPSFAAMATPRWSEDGWQPEPARLPCVSLNLPR